LGICVRRTGGLMAPVVAHILADLVIGYILLVTQIKA
jgi:membrane protease YdiL (CAAX protease family)